MCLYYCPIPFEEEKAPLLRCLILIKEQKAPLKEKRPPLSLYLYKCPVPTKEQKTPEGTKGLLFLCVSTSAQSHLRNKRCHQRNKRPRLSLSHTCRCAQSKNQRPKLELDWVDPAGSRGSTRCRTVCAAYQEQYHFLVIDWQRRRKGGGGKRERRNLWFSIGPSKGPGKHFGAFV